MKRVAVVAAVVTAIALIGPAAWAAPPSPGGVKTLRTFDPNAGQNPENLAVDKQGRIYIAFPFTGELRREDPDGSEHVVAHLPTENGFGPLGVAIDAPGTVYVDDVTFDASTQGVYRVDPSSGEFQRIPGTEAIQLANGITFDDRGTLYVTDSIAGSVWRIPKGGSAELWVQDELLAGDNSGPLPFPIGANGIAYRHRTMYVNNSEKGSIVSIPVAADGSAGTPNVLAQDPALGGADGLAMDVHGNLYVAALPQSSIVRVSPDGSSITQIASGNDGLDFASGVAFGNGKGDRTTLYIVNFSVGPLFGAPRTFGPALLAMDVGVPGLPQP